MRKTRKTLQNQSARHTHRPKKTQGVGVAVFAAKCCQEYPHRATPQKMQENAICFNLGLIPF